MLCSAEPVALSKPSDGWQQFVKTDFQDIHPNAPKMDDKGMSLISAAGVSCLAAHSIYGPFKSVWSRQKKWCNCDASKEKAPHDAETEQFSLSWNLKASFACMLVGRGPS
eukprot:1160057-Pelagomonas_calceolata.AAC.1